MIANFLASEGAIVETSSGGAFEMRSPMVRDILLGALLPFLQDKLPVEAPPMVAIATEQVVLDILKTMAVALL